MAFAPPMKPAPGVTIGSSQVKAPPKSKFFSAQEKMVVEKPSSILVHGALGSRKTSTALTASKFYPKLDSETPYPPFPEPVHLADTLIVGWDRQPLLFANKLNIWAPVLTMSQVNPIDLLDALADLHADLEYRVANGTELIIVDTVSAMDTKMTVKASQMFDPQKVEDQKNVSENKGKDDSQKLFRAMLSIHTNEFQFLTSLVKPNGEPVQLIFNCHTTVKGDPPTQKDKAKNDANRMKEAKGISTDGPQKVARITGAAWEFYHNQSGLIMHIASRKINGKDVATMYPQGGQDSMSRDRGGVLSPEEPADFRIILPKYERK